MSKPIQLSTSDAGKRRARVVAIVTRLPEAHAESRGTREAVRKPSDGSRCPCVSRFNNSHNRVLVPVHLNLMVGGRRFARYLDDHHGDGRLALDGRTPEGASETLVKAAPERFYIPNYPGRHGWIGPWLDLPEIDWAEVTDLLTEAYRETAPKSLIAGPTLSSLGKQHGKRRLWRDANRLAPVSE